MITTMTFVFVIKIWIFSLGLVVTFWIWAFQAAHLHFTTPQLKLIQLTVNDQPKLTLLPINCYSLPHPPRFTYSSSTHYFPTSSSHI